jgi:O-acetyl-ADP-ribose deacetylase (regulator of RNase III)
LITYINGDILNSSDKVIAHSVNARGVMNSGVAKVLRNAWPVIFNPYEAKHKSIGLALGEIIPVDVGEKIIVHLVTQENYGYDGKQYCDYMAIIQSLFYLNEYITSKNINSVSMPKISSGLAGGDWNLISNIIEQELKDINVNIWVL